MSTIQGSRPRPATGPVAEPAPSTTALRIAQRRSSHSPAMWGLIGVAGFLALLELVPLSGLVDPAIFPPLHEIALAFGDRAAGGAFWVALGQTLMTWLIGLGISTVAAVVLGTLIGGSRFLRHATSSTVEFLRPIPSVALIPVAVLLYGTGMGSTLLLVVYAAFWQMFVQVVQGMQDVDPVARDTARSYRFRRRTVLLRVTLPTALPYMVTGFRLSASVAVILTITGELIIGTPGLGNLITTAQSSGARASMYALVIVTGLLGLIVNLLTRAAERRALHWHASIRREQGR